MCGWWSGSPACRGDRLMKAASNLSGAALLGCVRPEPRRQRQGRAALGSAGREARLTGGIADREKPRWPEHRVLDDLSNAALPGCVSLVARRRLQVRRYGRAALGSAGQEARLTGGVAHRKKPRSPEHRALDDLSNAALPGCAQPEPRRQRQGRASLGSAGREARLTGGIADREKPRSPEHRDLSNAALLDCVRPEPRRRIRNRL
jgi:hypothetical protein